MGPLGLDRRQRTHIQEDGQAHHGKARDAGGVLRPLVAREAGMSGLQPGHLANAPTVRVGERIPRNVRQCAERSRGKSEQPMAA
jgi:hypothetical protein